MKKLSIVLLVISAMFIAMSVCASAAEGISGDKWYAKYVNYAEEHGFIELGGAFSENTPARAFDVVKAAAVIHAGGEKVFEGNDAVTYALENGLISRESDAGDAYATRLFAASVFAKVIKDGEDISKVDFLPDVSIFLPEHEEVLALYDLGILTGSDENGSFLPSSVISVEELCAIAARTAEPSLRVSVSLPSGKTLDDVLADGESDKTQADNDVYASTNTGFTVSKAFHDYIEESLGDSEDDSEDGIIKSFAATSFILRSNDYRISDENAAALKDNFELHWNSVKPIIEENSLKVTKYAYMQNFWHSMFYDALYYDYIYNARPTSYEIYDAYKDEFVLVKHVYVPFDAESEESKQSAAEKIQEAAKFLSDGGDFDDAVKEYGSDEAMLYNDFGYLLAKGDMPESFEDAAFGLDAGNISDIVETEYGYHIIKRYELTYEIFAENTDFIDAIGEYTAVENFNRMFGEVYDGVAIIPAE